MSAALQKPGRKFRFKVRSADEAVSFLREHYGDGARVVSVEQVGGKGLARFISSPELEVVARVLTEDELRAEQAARPAEAQQPAQPQSARARTHSIPPPRGAPPGAAPALPEALQAQPAETQQAQPAAATPAPAKPKSVAETPAPASGAASAKERRAARSSRRANRAAAAAGKPAPEAEAPAAATPAAEAGGLTSNTAAPATRERRAGRAGRASRTRARATAAETAPENATAAHPPAQQTSAAASAKDATQGSNLTPSGTETLDSLLKKANFDEELLGRMSAQMDWPRVQSLNLNQGLSEVFYWLKDAYGRIPQQPLAPRIAFMGTPGCGKTTALCKRMAADVFIHGKKIQVLKVEGDSPNPDESLRMLCDILGSDFLRDPVDLEKVDIDGELYVDVPGISLRDTKLWHAQKERLDELWVETRVLVLNAVYERDVLKDTLLLGQEVGCTHVVFTHLDELRNVTKLWPLVLNSGLTPLFLSYGQNVTSEFSEDILNFMTERTFPSYLNQQ